MSGGAWSRFQLAEYACWLAAGRGVLSLGQIIAGEVEDRMERREQAEKLLRKFIREEEAYDMLEKRVSKTAVRGYIDANKEVPPGIRYGTKLDVNIRKPAAR